MKKRKQSNSHSSSSQDWENGFVISGRVVEKIETAVLPGGLRRNKVVLSVPFSGEDDKRKMTRLETVVLGDRIPGDVGIGDLVRIEGQVMGRKLDVEYVGEMNMTDLVGSSLTVIEKR